MNTLVELARDSFFSVVFHLAPRFANVLLFVLIGRVAGPAEAGVFNLALTYLIIFTTVMRGLDDLVVRQVSREPDHAARYLTNFLLLRLGLSVLLCGVLVLVVLFVFHYAASTVAIILIMALSVVPESLSYVPQSILLGQRRFGESAIILAGASLLKLIGGWLVLIRGGNLQHVAWVWLAGSWLGMVVLLFVAARQIGGLRWADWFDWRPLIRNWQVAISFLFITTLMTLEGQADTVCLSAFHNMAEVGWYGAATTIAFSLAMFSQAYRFAMYPLMTRYALQSPEKLFKLYERSMRYLGVLVLPMVAGVVLLSPQIVSLVFGAKFQPTARVLQILTLALVFIFLNVPDARIMLVHDRQNWNFVFLGATVTVNILLNLALVPYWGASGAALARVSSSLLFFLLNHLYVTRFFVQLKIIRLLSRPVLATLVMALFVWAIRAWPLPISIGVGAVTYMGVLWFVGGILPDDAALLRLTIIGRLKNRSV